MALSHWFLPNKHTHQKATLISWEGLLIYVLLFILLQVSFSVINFLKPGVLGVTSTIDYKKIVELTNIERQKLGLQPVVENSTLNKAAAAKAANMLEENYWAHFAPSGKTPWDFILGSGYRFQFAGENLAKNFYSSEDVVTAWMNSPTHKENIINSKYQDIGIAVVEGALNGQKTTLVVQMFGSTSGFLAQSPEVNINGQKTIIPKNEYEKETLPQVAGFKLPSATPKPLIDPYLATKVVGFSVMMLMMTLLVVDFIILRRRGVFRLSSHYVAHFGFLTASAITLLLRTPGSIL